MRSKKGRDAGAGIQHSIVRMLTPHAAIRSVRSAVVKTEPNASDSTEQLFISMRAQKVTRYGMADGSVGSEQRHMRLVPGLPGLSEFGDCESIQCEVRDFRWASDATLVLLRPST